MMEAMKSEVSPARAGRFAGVRPTYLEALTLVERLHRRLLDVIKDEFDRRGRSDVNAVQALLLYNIADKELTAGELRTRGYYLGSNVSYNVKKLVETGYLHHARSRIDRRAVRISLTDKGRDIHDIVSALYDKHVATVEQIGGISTESSQGLTNLWSGSNASGPIRSGTGCDTWTTTQSCLDVKLKIKASHAASCTALFWMRSYFEPNRHKFAALFVPF